MGGVTVEGTAAMGERGVLPGWGVATEEKKRSKTVIEIKGPRT